MDRVTDALRLVAALSIVEVGLLEQLERRTGFRCRPSRGVGARIAALPRPVDLVIGVTWLVAGGANAAYLYVTDPWVDIPIHAATPVPARLPLPAAGSYAAGL